MRSMKSLKVGCALTAASAAASRRLVVPSALVSVLNAGCCMSEGTERGREGARASWDVQTHRHRHTDTHTDTDTGDSRQHSLTQRPPRSRDHQAFPFLSMHAFFWDQCAEGPPAPHFFTRQTMRLHTNTQTHAQTNPPDTTAMRLPFGRCCFTMPSIFSSFAGEPRLVPPYFCTMSGAARPFEVPTVKARVRRRKAANCHTLSRSWPMLSQEKKVQSKRRWREWGSVRGKRAERGE
jgi:hypothetical protein